MGSGCIRRGAHGGIEGDIRRISTLEQDLRARTEKVQGARRKPGLLEPRPIIAYETPHLPSAGLPKRRPLLNKQWVRQKSRLTKDSGNSVLMGSIRRYRKVFENAHSVCQDGIF